MKVSGILVVDNNPEILDVIERMFSYFNIKVDCCTSAVSTIDKLQNAPYRTLIIAIYLPDMVAMELAYRAHEIDPDLNIVLFIADSPEQVLKLTLEPTVSDVSEMSQKPYEFGKMLLDIKYRETGKIFLLE